MTKRIVLGDISEDQNGNAVIDTLEGDIKIENAKVVAEVPQANEWEFRDATVNHNGNDVTNVGAFDADEQVFKLGNLTVHNVAQYASSGDGTRSSPYIDGFNAALDDIRAGSPAVLYCPAGHYETVPVEMARGIRERTSISADFSTYTFPTIIGDGKWATNILLKNGQDDDLFKFSPSADVGTDQNTVGGGIVNATVSANKENNTAGSAVYFEPNTNANFYTHLVFHNAFIRNGADYALNDDDGKMQESHITSVTFNRSGTNVRGGSGHNRNHYAASKFNFARDTFGDGYGLDLQGSDNSFVGCEFRGNDQNGMVLRNDYNVFSGCTWVSNAVSTDTPQITATNGPNRITGSVDAEGNSTTAVNDMGSDNRFNLIITGVSTRYNEGTRTVVDGWGRNSGDPNSTGDWNGNGYEGAAVVDTTNSVKYVYRGGAWV